MPPKDGKVHVQARYFEDTLPYTVKSTRLHISIDASLNDLCTLLEQQCGGRVTVTDLFKPRPEHYKDCLPTRSLTTLLVANAADLNQLLDFVPLNDDTLNKFYDPKDVMLFIFIVVPSEAPAARPQTAPEAADKESDSLPPLTRELHRILPLYRQRPTPSVAATSAGYEKEQATTDAGLYDGRVAKNGPARSAPAIELYHPVFGEFLQGVHSTEEIPLEVLQLTAEFMRKLSVVRHSEAMRTSDVQSALNDLLKAVFLRVVNHSGTVADAVSVSNTSGYLSGCRMVVEWKGELGSGGSDPTVQVSFSFASIYTSPEREKILDASNCPCFLLSIAGSWISISGAVFTTRPIVQRLTDYLWVGRARVQDSKQVLRIARVINALLKPMRDLHAYYANLAIPSVAPRTGCEHPRFFPHITSYPKGNKTVEFAYVRPLQDSTACICFEVVLVDTEEHVVVKFVEQYGEAAHRWMAAHYWAPALRYCGLLDAESEHSYAGQLMVVMDLVGGSSLHDLYGATGRIPPEVVKEVNAASSALKAEGFVHGDLRRPNIMLLDTPAHGTRVRLIDFDWSGRAGEARYAFDLTSAITNATRAKDNDVVTVEHMDNLLAATLEAL